MRISFRGSLWAAVLAVMAGAAPIAGCSGTQAPPVEPATLVIQNGRIVTVDDATPEVRALAVRGDTIAALGTEEEIKAYIGPATQVIDLKGALAVPGLIDSHGHFNGIGQAKLGLELMATTSWDEIVAIVGEAVKKAKPGEWIVGRGWHQEKWTTRPEPSVEGFPTHASLDRVSPDNPVVLTHASGHASFANAKAMALAGVTRTTPNPAGGEILKDARGEPIGVLRESASGLVGRARAASRAKMTDEEREAEALRVIELANQECLSKGITSFHTAGESFSMVDRFKRVIENGQLGVRLYVMLGESNARLKEGLARYRTIGFGNNHLTVRAVKAYMDGALGSRGAWLLEPYADLPGHTGLNSTPAAELRETAELAIANGYQLCIHAIGDRANREVLDLYQATFKAHPEVRDLRWRDEHTQHLHPEDVPRYGELGVIAAMQGIHCTSDAPYVLARLGPKRAEEGAYVWRKLMKTGAVIANGTDAPVEDVDPIRNLYATATRKLTDGTVFFGDQKMTRMEALKSYTINGAFAAFEEGIKGSLTPGKLADVTVLSKDILTVPDDEILSAQVLYTIVGGKVLYEGK
ncbi:MAG: amidohydrolase [Vicinamibacterales bacterium]